MYGHIETLKYLRTAPPRIAYQLDVVLFQFEGSIVHDDEYKSHVSQVHQRRWIWSTFA